MKVVDAAGTVADVVEALEAQLDARGIRIFATIDHGAGARDAGLELADEVLIVFGNPAVGTILMQADPATGLDLPLRILVWDHHGQTRVAHHDPHDLAAVHRLPAASGVLDKLEALLDALTASVSASAGPAPAG